MVSYDRILGPYEGQIRPVISGEFPLLEAARANALLESGRVVGNLVLVAPELLESAGDVATPGFLTIVPE